MKRVFIIAEAGVNHNGSLGRAKKMIAVAAEAGADAVKFQTFFAEKGISKYAPKAQYQKNTTGVAESQLEMARALEFNEDEHRKLIECCKRHRILFLSTPFDLDSIDILEKLGLKILKIPSGEITNLPYLRKIGRLKKNIIMSTGMSYMFEIKKALDVLNEAGTPKKNITVLHCNTEYPTPYADANLLAMRQIKDECSVAVGYSDHTLGIEVPIAAVVMGAVMIEKHFTLDKKLPGPDHQASLGPDELRAMIRAVRNVEAALGTGVKKPSLSELKNIPIARKSIVAGVDIQKHERFSVDNLMVKRPGTGVSPMKWDTVIGKKAKKSFKKDKLIEI